MTDSNSTSRARRIRNALLASVFTLGLAGAGGALLTENQVALADPVETPAVAPADFTAVIETVRPAVVGVQVRTKAEQVANRSMPNFGRGMPDMENVPPELREFFRQFGMPRGFGDEDEFPPRRDGRSQGSGFFISEDGYVVTNNHVVEDSDEIVVITDDGRELDARLIGTDERTDLALLKVDGGNFTYVKLSQETPKVGQWVIAVGNPFGLGGTVTAGIISAEGRDIGAGPYDNFLQIDAPVNRGNSGGPTFNTRGEVIGVNTAIFSPSGGNVGIAFAIPAATVQEIVNDLKEDGEVTRGWLGVQIQPVTEDIAESLGVEQTDGAIVADAQADSPAEKAGIKAGDIITKVNGNPVKGPKELSQTIASFEPNEEITVTVNRDGAEQDIAVTLGDLKQLDESQQASLEPDATPEETEAETLEGLGLAVEKNPDGAGVVVTEVDENSPAAEKGLEQGDVIVAIGGKAVDDVADVESGIAAAKKQGRGAVLLKVQGENGTHFVGVPFERG
jgi:serine protease Do